MSSFFKTTHTASQAFYADCKFRAYYHAGFHLDAITTFFCHILRALYNLIAFLYHMVRIPFCILNPLFWPDLPNQALNLLDDLVGLSINLVTIAVHPLIVLIRSLSSLIFGYAENKNYEGYKEEEQEDLGKAMCIYT